MSKRKYLILSIGIFALIAITHLIARHFSWYQEYWYTDIFLHVLSGVAFGSLVFCRIKDSNFSRSFIYLSVCASSLILSYFWEVWEYLGNTLIPRKLIYLPIVSDTLGDIACGLAGGMIMCLLDWLISRRK